MVNSFNPGLGGLNGVGFDDSTDSIFLHPSHSTSIYQYDLAGNQLGSIPDPGDDGNDSDYFFTSHTVNINGTSVPADSLLVIEHETGVAQLIAANPITGAVLATVDLNFVTGQLVGGAYHPATDTFFAIDWSADVVYQFDGADGSLLNTFGVGPNFDVYYGDLAVNEADGNLYLVSSSQDFLRVLDTAGNFVRDVDLSAVGVLDMSGIAFRESTGEVIIASTNGTIYQVDGLPASILPGSYLVTRGEYVYGDEVDLFGADNVDLSARRSLSDIQSRVVVEVEGTSITATPSSITLRFEGSVFARSTVTQTLQMYDFDLGTWEDVDTRNASRFTDAEVLAMPGGDLSRFVDAGSLAVRARVQFNSPNRRQNFTAYVDQMIWTVD